MLFPCCFVRVGESREALKALLGDSFDQLDLKKYSYEEIVNSKAWKKIIKSIYGRNPLSVCVEMCAAEKSLDNKGQGLHDGRNRFTKFQN